MIEKFDPVQAYRREGLYVDAAGYDALAAELELSNHRHQSDVRKLQDESRAANTELTECKARLAEAEALLDRWLKFDHISAPSIAGKTKRFLARFTDSARKCKFCGMPVKDHVEGDAEDPEMTYCRIKQKEVNNG